MKPNHDFFHLLLEKSYVSSIFPPWFLVVQVSFLNPALEENNGFFMSENPNPFLGSDHDMFQEVVEVRRFPKKWMSLPSPFHSSKF